MIGCGLVVLALGLVSTTARARETARRTAERFAVAGPRAGRGVRRAERALAVGARSGTVRLTPAVISPPPGMPVPRPGNRARGDRLPPGLLAPRCPRCAGSWCCAPTASATTSWPSPPSPRCAPPTRTRRSRWSRRRRWRRCSPAARRRWTRCWPPRGSRACAASPARTGRRTTRPRSSRSSARRCARGDSTWGCSCTAAAATRTRCCCGSGHGSRPGAVRRAPPRWTGRCRGRRSSTI